MKKSQSYEEAFEEWARIRNAEIDLAERQGTTSFSLLLERNHPEVLSQPGESPRHGIKLDEPSRLLRSASTYEWEDVVEEIPGIND